MSIQGNQQDRMTSNIREHRYHDHILHFYISMPATARFQVITITENHKSEIQNILKLKEDILETIKSNICHLPVS